MAKRNKAAFFHAHRQIFVDLARPEVSRQQARAIWHRMFKAKDGAVGFPRAMTRHYNTATRILGQQMRAVQQQEKEAA